MHQALLTLSIVYAIFIGKRCSKCHKKSPIDRSLPGCRFYLTPAIGMIFFCRKNIGLAYYFLSVDATDYQPLNHQLLGLKPAELFFHQILFLTQKTCSRKKQMELCDTHYARMLRVPQKASSLLWGTKFA